MGGLQMIRLCVGIVQAKIVAVLLGASGTGLFGIYASLLNFGQSLFSLGTAGSGVREIAALAGCQNRDALARAMQIQVWTSVLLALSGCMIFLLFRGKLGLGMAMDDKPEIALSYLAAALAITIATGAPLAILQGMRKISWLVMANVWGTLGGAVCAVFSIYFYRENGIAPAFLANALCSGLAALWYYRRLDPVRVPVTWRQGADGFVTLVRLGSGFMATAFFLAMTAYGVRLFLVRLEGLEAAGYYQAAWMLSTFYGGMILQAMGTDFLPRISALSGNHASLNQAVNEQVEVGLLLMVPGMLLCAAAAPLVLKLLYTGEFMAAIPAARWMIAGVILRAMVWPLAYMPLAMNRPKITAYAEGVYAGLTLAISYPAIRWAGVEGAGIAYAVSSIVYTACTFIIARRLSDFAWLIRSKRLILLLYGAAALVYFLLWLGSNRASYFGAVLAILFIALGCFIKAWRMLKLKPQGKPGTSHG